MIVRTGISGTSICTTEGKRACLLKWNPASSSATVPSVEKYRIQAFDPKYGKFLLITTIEGDFCQEEKRWRDVSEITSYKIEEATLGKLRHIFAYSKIKLQVAAQNRIGLGRASPKLSRCIQLKILSFCRLISNTFFRSIFSALDSAAGD